MTENAKDNVSLERSQSHEDSNSFNKQENLKQQASECEVILGEEDLIIIDNLKLDKDKIKRRRSSLGKYLSEARSSSSDYNSVEIRNSASNHTMDKEDIATKNMVDNGVNGVPYTEQDNTKSESELALLSEIKMYEEKTEKLKLEYAAWKNLGKSRKRKLANASREYKEAKQGDTRIEEDDITPQHKKELKSITLSQPDYNQYLKQINISYEQALLTDLEIRKFTIASQSFNDLSNIISRNSFRILKEKVCGVKRDPREILRQFQDV